MFVCGAVTSCFRALLFVFTVIVLSLLAFGNIVLAQTSHLAPLEAGKTVYRDLSGGQKHSFQVNLNAGDDAKLLVEQRGLDVVVRLIGDGGKPAIEFDADPRNNGEEPVEFASKTGGKFVLTVEPRQRSAAAGRYEIHLVETHPASEKELALDESRRLSTR